MEAGFIERLYGRLLMAVGRGRVTVTNDAGPVQTMQIKLGQDEVRDGTPRLADYGVTSVPPVGSDALVVFIGGDRSAGAVVATGHQGSRPKGLAVGEVCVYDDQGQMIHITRAGIVIKGAGKPITIQDTPTLTVKASSKVRFETPLLEVTGDVLDNSATQSRTMKGMREVYNTHTHGGVQSGSAHTAVPDQTE